MGYVEADAMLRFMYLSATNKRILNETDQLVFADVLYRPEESIEAFDHLPDLIEEYYLSQVKKTLGMTFEEWMDLPVHVKNKVSEVSGAIMAEESNKFKAMDLGEELDG